MHNSKKHARHALSVIISLWAVVLICLLLSPRTHAQVTTNSARTGISGGSGSVTSVSVTTANGLGGTVATPTTTPAITLTTGVTGIVKGNGTGLSAAVSGTDYAPATATTSILKGNGSGGFSAATSGSDYAPATATTSLLKGNGSGGFAAAVSGTDLKTINSTSLLGSGDIAISASPAGSSTQLQYNNAGAFGAMSGTAWDDTNRSLTVTGATVTTSKPLFDLSQTWNGAGVAFTAIKAVIDDRASNDTTSNLLDFRTLTNAGSVNRISLQLKKWSASGTTLLLNDYVTSLLIRGGDSATTPWGIGNGLQSNDEFFIFRRNGAPTTATLQLYMTTSKAQLTSAHVFGFASGTADTAMDIAMARKAAGILEVNAGTAGTYAGTAFGNGVQTVAQLPACGSTIKGFRAQVSDSTPTFTSANFGAAVTGSGSNFAPVICDGTSWKIG